MTDRLYRHTLTRLTRHYMRGVVVVGFDGVESAGRVVVGPLFPDEGGRLNHSLALAVPALRGTVG